MAEEASNSVVDGIGAPFGFLRVDFVAEGASSTP